MLKTRSVFALLGCLLLTTTLALPSVAQSTSPQGTTPQTQSPSTTPTPSQDMNRDQTNPSTQTNPSDVNRDQNLNNDVDRQKPAGSTNQADEGRLPGTAGGLPVLALIGSASLIGSAIRRWL